MPPLNPDDLNGKEAAEVASLIFGIDVAGYPWMTLERVDTRAFKWIDYRIGLEWRATHGYLIALQEVSSLAHAKEFAKKNRIKLFESGGLYFQGHAEIFIRCQGLTAADQMTRTDLYQIELADGISFSLGPASLLFTRLVGKPAVEAEPKLPDPSTYFSLVISGVHSKDEVAGLAELGLYYLRKNFKGITFGYCEISDLHRAAQLPDAETSPEPPQKISALSWTDRYEPIAFFNRAHESDHISGFLYYYRVVEACFDQILSSVIDVWRKDPALDTEALLKNIRKIQFKEDLSALRLVLGQIVDQQLLDQAYADQLIDQATADSLATHLYSRRNSIAHGRRGQHTVVLVPYGINYGEAGMKDRQWWMLMRELASRSLHKWIIP